MIFNETKIFKQLEKEISSWQPGKNPAELYDPVSYIMSLGGKRTRPMLTLLATWIFSGKVEKAIKPAMAIEVFHNFTLLHDDIMDQAPLRRGKSTVHEKWNTNTAILSGDVMLVKAYELLLNTEKEIQTEVIKTFSRAAAQVCEGQQLDVNYENRDDVSEEEYISMISLKTAALIGYALELGAIIAKAREKNTKHLREFGINIGIAFQLMDDLLDVYGAEEKFGKKPGGDIASNKKTFLLIHALKNVKGSELKTLRTLLKEKNSGAQKVKQIKQIYDKLNVQQAAEEKMKWYFDKAMTHLKKVDAPLYRKALLKSFAERLMKREQ